MEGEAEEADAALFLLLLQEVEDAELQRLAPVFLIEAVEEVKIYVINAKTLKLLLKDGLRLFKGIDHGHGQLGGEEVALARIGLKRAAGEFLALAVVVEISCVKVVDARLVRAIQHLCRAWLVDFALGRGGVAHTAEAQAGNAHAQLVDHRIFHISKSSQNTFFFQSYHQGNPSVNRAESGRISHLCHNPCVEMNTLRSFGEMGLSGQIMWYNFLTEEKGG